MPLTEMSPNILEAETVTRKRSHDEFSGEFAKPVQADTQNLLPTIAITIDDQNSDNESELSSAPNSPILTPAGSSTPTRVSPCPLTPTQASSNPFDSNKTVASSTKPAAMKNPAPKRKRLSDQEKQARDKELQEKKKEREDKASAKAAEKAKQEEEKAARIKEREDKRKKKEEEEKAKAEQRDEKRRKKEEELQRIEDEKDKKARSQKTLNSFFKGPSTPKKPDVSAIKTESPLKAQATSGAKSTVTPYEKLFKPFYVKKDMKWTSLGAHMDQTTKENKSLSLDSYIANPDQASGPTKPFNPNELLGLPVVSVRRGRQYYPVKHIMEMVYKQTAASGKAGKDDTNTIIKQAEAKLAKVPMKIIAFSQDVRPPYYGTITYQPFALGEQHMQSLARKPINRVLPLDYDFDSEAEWQEEEGEDVDMDDDEEELDDEDDMDGFLDDSEDAGLNRRIFANTIEPESSGICFETVDMVGPESAIYIHKLEFMHERMEDNASIDPWGTQYWESETSKTKAPKTVQTSDKTAKMAPPPAPSNAFDALTSHTAGNAAPAAKLVKSEFMDELKQTVEENNTLSKVGIIDFVFQKMRGKASRVEVTNTITLVAERVGKGRDNKKWTIKEGH